MAGLFLTVYACSDSKADSGDATQSNATAYQAARPGDSVWIFINHVKPDKRAQFEKFVHEVFWPMAQKLNKSEHRYFEKTRVLSPVAPEADGTYSYLFIMDPVLPGSSYELEPYLKKMFGDKWQEYGTMFGETQAREQTAYRVVQDKYYQYK